MNFVTGCADSSSVKITRLTPDDNCVVITLTMIAHFRRTAETRREKNDNNFFFFQLSYLIRHKANSNNKLFQ